MQPLTFCKISLLLWAACSATAPRAAPDNDWNEAELALLRLQWIGSLPALPPDPTNRFADNPLAARLGQKLFFDNRLSGNGEVSCASCHIPDAAFTDGLARARGMGETARSTPGILGIAHSPWYFWDGRSDSQWSQALGPLESAVEHGGNRSQYARIIFHDPLYRTAYEALFGPMPDLTDTRRFPENAAPVGSDTGIEQWQQMSATDRRAVTTVFVNIGKSIAAYERLLIPGPSRFDDYIEAVLHDRQDGIDALTDDEIAGLRLFIGKAMCITCHLGPLFTNHGFHNVGAPGPATEKPGYMLPIFYLFKDKPAADNGRLDGLRQLLASEFNCMGEYSDARATDCAELKFANQKRSEISGAFKVPTLRNIANTAPYMHAGQFHNLANVLQHYNRAPGSPVGNSELIPLKLNDVELAQIEAFLHSLDSPPAIDARLLKAP